MGLDMYLYKVPKIEGMTFEEIAKYDEELEGIIEKGGALYERLKPHIKEVGEYIHWKSVFEKIGYWRKANQIHNWFVEQVQDGVDECQLSIVSKEKAEELYLLCHSILNNKKNAADVLPTQSGFFFGSTDYDEYYFEDIQSTIDILQPVVEGFDHNHYYLVYRSSW